LGEHGDPIAPWHRNPVDVLLRIQPDVRRKHGDEDFCIGVYPIVLPFKSRVVRTRSLATSSTHPV
jgi:hypothetical protein